MFPWLGLDYARSDRARTTAIARPSGGPLRNIAGRSRQETVFFRPALAVSHLLGSPAEGRTVLILWSPRQRGKAQTISSEVLSGLRTRSARTIPRWMRP
jgi:hypothetical protein